MHFDAFSETFGGVSHAAGTDITQRRLEALLLRCLLRQRYITQGMMKQMGVAKMEPL